MSQRPLTLWLIGVAILMVACGSTSVESATSSPTAIEGDGSAVRGTSAEPSPTFTVGPAGDRASPAPTSEADCTSDPAPVFSHHYTDLDQVDFINPTIVTSGNWLKNRQYHKVVTDAQNNAPEVPLYAPADAVVRG